MKRNNIGQLRKSIKLKMSRNSQEAIAKSLGISQTYLSMLLNGKRNPKNKEELLKKVNTILSTNFSKN